MNKTAQFTELDKELLDKGAPARTYYNRNDRGTQSVLPFEDWNTKQDIEESHKQQAPKPTQPMNLRYPEISPEMIKYRGLSEKELKRIRDEDDEDYKRHQDSWYRKNTPFEPHNKRYYELNKALPEDVKKEVINKYNQLRAAAIKFQEKYNEANKIASEDVELDYSGTYIDLFKNFGKFITSNIRKYLGVLFGVVPESGRSNSYYSTKAKNLAKFVNEGVNLFNITPFNVETKIHEMSSAIHAMNSIINEYERRKKVLKKLPEVEMDVKRYLLKRDHRAFLKWMDEYFPNDKQDFMQSAIKEIMETYESSHGSNFKLGNLKKIKTYSDIWFKSKQSATTNLYLSMERKVESEIKERLQEELTQRISPKIMAFHNVVMSSSADNMDGMVKYIYKNFKLDLKSILGYVETSMRRYYGTRNEMKEDFRSTIDERDKVPEDIIKPEDAETDTQHNFAIFKGNFMEDLKSTMRELEEGLTNRKDTWRLNHAVESIVRDYTAKYFGKTGIKHKEISEVNEQEINELILQYFRSLIIEKLPNFARKSSYNYEYALPGFAGIGNLMKETGKFSIDSIVNYVHTSVPFVPKDFILNLVRSLFKNQIPKMSETNNLDNIFESLYNLRGTTPATAMKVFLDLLKRSGKLNPNSFTNEFVKSFKPINQQVGRFIAEMKEKFSEADTIEFFGNALRNTDTVERDNANLGGILSFIHNSAGHLDKTSILKLIKNKNFPTYSKVGIVKKLFHMYAQIKNMGGLKGIYQKYGEAINLLKKEGFVSKGFDGNVRFIVKVFNSGEPISPASPFFRKLFEVTSAMETDLQAVEMGSSLKEMLVDYQEKDQRLFKLNLQINDRLRFRVLKDRDPRALRVGIESDCCQRIGGVGEAAAKDSFINPMAGVLLLQWYDGGEWKLLAQSYFHFVPKDNGYILDNVEFNRENFNNSGVDLSAAYAYLAQKINQKFNVGYFLAGKSYSKVNTSNFKTKKLRGGDPRFFDSRAGSRYTDFSPSDAMDLLTPKFDLAKRTNELTQEGKDIKEAFEVNIFNIIKTAMVA